MKIEENGKGNYIIFINSEYMNKQCCSTKEEKVDFIKRFMLKMKNKLKLRGFYKIKVFIHDRIGMFLEAYKLDDIDITNNLDLRVIIMSDNDFYFETDDYEIISNCNEKRYKDGMFYCIVDESFDKILEKVELGRFIYGGEVINLLNNSLIL